MAVRTAAAAAHSVPMSSGLRRVPASGTSKAAQGATRPTRGSTPAWPRQALVWLPRGSHSQAGHYTLDQRPRVRSVGRELVLGNRRANGGDPAQNGIVLNRDLSGHGHPPVVSDTWATHSPVTWKPTRLAA